MSKNTMVCKFPSPSFLNPQFLHPQLLNPYLLNPQFLNPQFLPSPLIPSPLIPSPLIHKSPLIPSSLIPSPLIPKSPLIPSSLIPSSLILSSSVASQPPLLHSKSIFRISSSAFSLLPVKKGLFHFFWLCRRKLRRAAAVKSVWGNFGQRKVIPTASAKGWLFSSLRLLRLLCGAYKNEWPTFQRYEKGQSEVSCNSLI